MTSFRVCNFIADQQLDIILIEIYKFEGLPSLKSFKNKTEKFVGLNISVAS